VQWQAIGLALVCVLVWHFLPAEWQALRGPLGLVFVAFVALYPLRVAVAALQGLQEHPFLAKIQLLGWTLGTCTTIALVVADAGLYALVAGWIVGLAVPSAAAMWRIRGRWPRRMPTPSSDVRQYFHRSIWVSVGQVAQVLLAGSDVLLLGRLLGPAAIVPYACTGKLVTVFANHPQLLMHAAQPASVNCAAPVRARNSPPSPPP